MNNNEQAAKQALESKAETFAAAEKLFEGTNRVIAAVSGGADSMALLLFLMRLAERGDFALEAIHVNHGLRGENARRDEEFVRSFCENRGVPLTVCRLEEEGEIPPHPGEEWARDARYACFERLAAKKKACVATAHTLNDQAETLLFRLARGCGVRGAGAIAPRRGIYVRPLLCLRREETEKYCALYSQGFVQDETNESELYARNLLRHKAVPALRQANAGALEAMGRFCEQMRQVDAYLTEQAKHLLQEAAFLEGWQAQPLLQAPAPVRTAALRLILQNRAEAEARHIDLMEQTLQTGGAVQLNQGLRFLCKEGVVSLKEEHQQPAAAPPQPLQLGETLLPGGYRLQLNVTKYENSEKNAGVHKKDLNNQADYDKIQQAKPILRTRGPQDRFRPNGRGLSKPLKKWLNEWKIPREERALLPVIGSNIEILWVWGRGFAEGYTPDEKTQRVLTIELIKPSGG